MWGQCLFLNNLNIMGKIDSQDYQQEKKMAEKFFRELADLIIRYTGKLSDPGCAEPEDVLAFNDQLYDIVEKLEE